MGDGFFVDIDALKDAGLGLADLLAELDQLKVEDIDCARSSIGHDPLADVFESFTARWQEGINNLTEDGSELSQRLVNCAGHYIETDQLVEQDLQSILDADSGHALPPGGDDPRV